MTTEALDEWDPDFVAFRSLFVDVFSRIARLVGLGIRQARYSGREKTLSQLLMVATVANFALITSKTGLMRGGHPRVSHRLSLPLVFFAHVRGFLRLLSLVVPSPSGFSARFLGEGGGC